MSHREGRPVQADPSLLRQGWDAWLTRGGGRGSAEGGLRLNLFRLNFGTLAHESTVRSSTTSADQP